MRVHAFRMWFGATLRQGVGAARRAGLAVSRRVRASLGKIEGAVAGAGELGRVLSGLPAIAARSVSVLNQFEDMTRNGLVLAPETVAAIGKAEAKRNRGQTAALWAIAAAFLVILWKIW